MCRDSECTSILQPRYAIKNLHKRACAVTSPKMKVAHLGGYTRGAEEACVLVHIEWDATHIVGFEHACT